MAVRISSGLRDAILAGGNLQTIFNAGVVQYRTGSQPSDADDAPSGTLVGDNDLEADAFTAPSGGAIAANGVPLSENAVAGGTIGWGRIIAPGDGGGSSTSDPRIDFSVSLTGAGGDVQGDKVAYLVGEPIQLDTLALLWPKS